MITTNVPNDKAAPHLLALDIAAEGFFSHVFLLTFDLSFP
jgi:hypothetical protein